MDTRRGMALVLAAGVAVLLGFVAAAFLAMARSAGTAGRGALEASVAACAAESGMEYAAARLSEEWRPRFPGGPVTRGDDWTCRQGPGIGVQGSDNPSYSHGEPWEDLALAPDGADNDLDGIVDEPDEGTGLHSPAEGVAADLDGDGRFSAWSGRLRGGDGPRRIRFALRIEAHGTGIPLNGGSLLVGDGIDNDGNGLVDEPGEKDQVDNNWNGVEDEAGEVPDADGWWRIMPPKKGPPNGIPDHCDLRIALHAGIAAAIDGLCGALGVSPPLGGDSILLRPRGGYRSWEGYSARMSAAGHSASDLARVRPYLDIGAPPWYAGWSFRGAPTRAPAGAHVLIHLAAARPPVLEGVWRGLTQHSPYDRKTAFPAESAAWAAVCPWSGEPYWKLAAGNVERQEPLRIWPEEAKALAAETVALRASGGLTWGSLRRRFADRAEIIFSREAAALVSFPVFRQSWLAAKAALAWGAVSQDAYPFDSCWPGLAGWAAGGDIDGDHDRAGIQTPPPIAFELDSPYEPYDYSQESCRENAPLAPQGFTLSPLTRFSVESAGAAGGASRASVSGELASGMAVEFSSQRHFKLFDGGADPVALGALARIGIEAVDGPSAYARRGGTVTSQPSIVTVPCYGGSRDSLSGGLTLAGAGKGVLGAQLHWGFPEKVDGTYDGGSQVNASDPYVPKPVATGWPGPYGMGATTPPEDGRCAPYALSGMAAPQCPGFDRLAPPDDIFPAPTKAGTQWNPFLKEFSIEGWFGPASSLSVWSGGGGPISTGSGRYTFTLSTRRDWARPPLVPSEDPARTGTVVRLEILWISGGWKLQGPQTPKTWTPFTPLSSFVLRTSDEWFLEDDPAVPGPPQCRHLFLTMRREGGGRVDPASGILDYYRSAFQLYVDGTLRPDVNGSLTHLHWDPSNADPFKRSGGLRINTAEGIEIHAVDEVRCYAKAWPGPGAAGAAPADRFVRKGTYVSPLFRLDAPAALKEVQWHGIVPSSCRAVSAAGRLDLVQPFGVEVEGYWDRAGTSVAATVPLPAGQTGPLSLTALGMPSGIRSFRYRVTIDATGVYDPLRDTPVFESIWLALQPRGVAPAWSAWESR